MKTKESRKLTLKDRLSRLTYCRACQLLGPQGEQLIRQGATYDEIDIDRDVYFRGDLFRLKLPSAGPRRDDVVVTITTMAAARNRLRFNCTACQTLCEHIGAAVSLILEEKTALRLAEPPEERVPLERLSEKELIAQALRDREERAQTEKFRLRSSDPQAPWSDYTITSALSGKTYRVALRGPERGQSYCSCPDFHTNTLGTCKHILYSLDRVRARFPESVRRKPYVNREAFVHVLYGEEISLHLQLPDRPDPELVRAAGCLANGPIEDVRRLVNCVAGLERQGSSVTVYPDAEELIQKRLFQQHVADQMAEIHKDPAGHPLRTELLKVPLLPYQLDDLYSVVQFVDDRRLAPAFRFFHRHRVVNENGKVLGYKNLDQLRENLKPILLRRTRKSVLQQLPPRTTEIVRIPPTEEQAELHDTHIRIVSMITRKAYISEWTTMLGLIEPMLRQRKLDYVRLDGSVPQKKRQQLVNRFRDDPRCRLFITTNAGSTGLNLQAANTVINVDLPWNPAVLEQRISRAHRMGQQQPVQVYVLITEETLEEKLLNTLSAKHDLALAALDSESEVTEVDLASGIEELRRRLEVLLGAQPEAPVDVTQKEAADHQALRLAEHRDRVAAAGGELLGAVFNFLGELVSQDQVSPPPETLVSQVRGRLTECVEEDASGKPRLTITLPDRRTLDTLAQTLARLLGAGGGDKVS